MIEMASPKQLKKDIEIEKDFYKSELLNLGYFKTSDGRQLYELSLRELKYIHSREGRKSSV